MENCIKEKIVTNFSKRNIAVEFYNDVDDLNNRIQELIPNHSSIGVGHSTTLKQINIVEKLKNRGNKVFDKTLAENKEQIKALKKKSLLTDWYISGSNALSTDGHIVNIDHSGNRVAALMYGPDNVIIVVGTNKVVNTLEDAISRAKNIAANQNAKRAGYNPPCVTLKHCVDCNSDQRVCNYLSIIQGQYEKNRMKILIINEELGF